MFHVAAYYESVDPGGVLYPLNAVPEQMLATYDNDIRVSKLLSNIIGAAALCNDASVVRAQVQSPTLRMLGNLDIEPIVAALVFGAPPEQSMWPDAPVPLTPDEALNFAIESNPAAGVVHYGLVFLSDGAQGPVVGNILSVRCTAACALSGGVWVNGNLTFGQVLPAGRYAVVGMRARSANLVAARLVFQEQVARPGCLAVNALGDNDPYWPRYGRLGAWGEFDSTTPPTIDCLGVTDTAEYIIIDLVRIK